MLARKSECSAAHPHTRLVFQSSFSAIYLVLFSLIGTVCATLVVDSWSTTPTHTLKTKESSKRDGKEELVC